MEVSNGSVSYTHLGCEAWAEQRRTGYPKLFKVVVNNSSNAISTDDMIRRVFFNQDYITNNKPLYDALVSKLGGLDTGCLLYTSGNAKRLYFLLMNTYGGKKDYIALMMYRSAASLPNLKNTIM